MNEAERCDRISLMHAGPRAGERHAGGAGRGRRGAASLEEAFIGYLEEATGDGRTDGRHGRRADVTHQRAGNAASARFSLRRLLAYARREALELLRDPIRLAFALLGSGPADAGLRLRHHDRRGGPALRRARPRPDAGEPRLHRELRRLRATSCSSAPLAHAADLDRRMHARRAIAWRIEIPPGFGRDLRAAAPRRSASGSTAPCRSAPRPSRGYVQGVHSAVPATRCCARTAVQAPLPRRRRSGDALPLQPGLPQPLRHGARRHHDAADLHPRHPDGARRGAREGARLDHQPLRHAGHGAASSCSASSCPTSG